MTSNDFRSPGQVVIACLGIVGAVAIVITAIANGVDVKGFAEAATSIITVTAAAFAGIKASTAARQGEEAAVKVEAVKQVADETALTLDTLQNVTDLNHGILNGGMSVLLEEAVNNRKELSRLVDTPENAAKLAQAQGVLAEHQQRSGPVEKLGDKHQ